ncbi:MAG: response regulator transcription factor [Terracidiphilus sp.]|jgi:DNA-binding response OmpR family regulator
MPSAHFFKFAMTSDTLGGQGKKGPCVRILLVDDSIEILDHVSNMLRPEYDVIGKVADGNLVCSKVASLSPDVIILDISLGDRSGIEIAQRLREQGYAKEIIFLSVHEDPDFVIAAIGAGGRAYVTKPRITEDLRSAVKAVLSHQVFISAPLKWE